ncbi:MAG: glycoside hydrolase family 97 protein [Acidobacteriaceae bacterium]
MLRLSISILLAGALSAGGAAAVGQEPQTVLFSPNHQLQMRFTIKPPVNSQGPDGALDYSVSFHGKPILDDSALALELDGGPALGSEVHITGAQSGSGVDDYTLLDMKTSKVHDAYNSLKVNVAESGSPQRVMTLEARAYNDGIAFRYVLPEQEGIQQLRLRQEDTEFRLSDDAIDWALELPNYQSSYESEYVRLPTSAFSNHGGVSSHFLIGLPLLMHEPGRAWMALLESDLEGNSAMYVANPSGNWAGHWFVSRLSPQIGQPDVAVTGTLPHHSAWRVLLVADHPGQLIESNLVYDLNPPNRLRDTSWIHAGKASWNWWVGDIGKDGKSAYTTRTMEYYVDFAARSGFRYMMLDAGWSAGGGITKLNGKVDVPALARYAAARHVKVWGWIYSKSAMRQMKTAFPLYEKWGVAGVKIDFINRNDQQGIQFYYDVAREAAKDHLMVDFHGTTTPWGLARTYPNVRSYEGVLGMENNKVGRRDSPVDRTVFPFTRLLAGPMDYTPGGFRNATEAGFVARDKNPMVMGTRAQQLALYVIFQTPIQMVSDSPQTYAGQPAFQFIKDVPASWDATRVLDGYPGKFVVMARRHGDDWYLGGITNWTPRTLRVPLTFLGSGTYTAEIYADAAGAHPRHVAISRQVVNAGQTLSLKLASGGGCAIRFTPRRGM